jgi:pimeloyl-ACP methyl ester carboxylesterase
MTYEVVPTFSTGYIVSRDGTTIGYRQIGLGPGVILVHGSMQSSQNLMDLGHELSGDFTVYIPDRRGRGLSGSYGENYGIQTEVDDLLALLTQTGANKVFGLSSGALIALRTALVTTAVRKLALYEPPFPVGTPSPMEWVSRYQAELARGDLAAAMVTIIKGTADPSGVALLPRFVLERLMRMAITGQGRNGDPHEIPLKELIPTMKYDAQLPPAFDGTLDNYRAFDADVLLLGGSKSRDYLKNALDSLERVLPKNRRVEFASLGHLASDNSGKPKMVAQELMKFFTVTE